MESAGIREDTRQARREEARQAMGSSQAQGKGYQYNPILVCVNSARSGAVIVNNRTVKEPRSGVVTGRE